MKLNNKTITYKLKATDENGAMQLIDDSASCQLPSIDKLSDTIKGAGILGEIDFPAFGQIGSMAFSVSARSDNEKYAMLARPGAINIELVWVTDIFDSGSLKIKTQQNKVFMTVFNKKYDPGKIESGATSDGSSEFEVIYYRKITDGKEVLLIDKFNYKYAINGVDYMDGIRAALD